MCATNNPKELKGGNSATSPSRAGWSILRWLLMKKYQSTDFELEALRNIWSAVLLLTLEDVKNKTPRGTNGNPYMAYSAKLSALQFVNSEFCQTVCEFLGVDYRKYRETVLKFARKSFINEYGTGEKTKGA